MTGRAATALAPTPYLDKTEGLIRETIHADVGDAETAPEPLAVG